MGYAASCVLWWGSLVGQAEGRIQQQVGLQISFSAQAVMGTAALKLVKLFAFVLMQTDLYPKFPDSTGPLTLLCKLFTLPFSQLEQCWATRLAGLVSNPYGQMGLEDNSPHRWGCDSAVCLGVGEVGPRPGKTACLRI